MASKSNAIRLMLLLVSIVYSYLLVKIILFKFGTPDPSFLLGQLQRLAEDPSRLATGLRLGNLVPGDSIRENIDHFSNGTDKVNLLGNIALFVPAGILIRLGLGRGILFAASISFLISLALESGQLIFSIGTFDVDDLILNTSGGVLGYMLIRVAQWFDKTLLGTKQEKEKKASSSPRLQ